MSLAAPGGAAITTQPAPHERPWVFAFLIAPDAVFALGLAGGALSFLLRNEGVDPARAASIVSLLALPHAIYFLWGPITDFWMKRRSWLMLGAVSTALAVLLAFHQSRLGSKWGVGLLGVAACLGVVVAAACGGMMGTLRAEANRRRAGSFYQSGSLALSGLAIFLVVSLAGLRMPTLGWILAAMIALPALAVFAAPTQPELTAHDTLEGESRVWSEFRSTFLRWEAVPYTLLMIFPTASGAMIGLLPELARDYGVSGSQVAWINGLAGALLTAAGSLAASLIPARVRAPIAFLVVGLINSATLAILAVGQLRPAIYYTGTALFLFTVGAGYALFTGVVLEFMGGSGKSGSTRYAIINSLGNLPVAYMSYVDGRAYAHWGPRGMPGADAIISAAGELILLAHFVVSSGLKSRRESAEIVTPVRPEA